MDEPLADKIKLPAVPKERFHFLDGLRGIAAILIVIHHAFTSNIAKWFTTHKLPFVGFEFTNFTQSGVELFFVLSGVVLLRPYLRGYKKLNVPNYFSRRFTRIYPPYFAALCFGAFVMFINAAFPSWYSVILIKFTWTETFKEAFMFSTSTSYYNLAWWSLQIELLFYFSVPLILLVFPIKKGINDFKFATLVIATLLLCTLVQIYGNNHFPQYYGYPNIKNNIFKFIDYPVCFLMGIYIAAKDSISRKGVYFACIGVVAILASYYFMPIVNAGYGLFYAGIIIITFNNVPVKKFLSKPLMIWLGERSYSLFLIHFSVFYLTDNIVAHFTTSRNGTYALLSRGLGIPFGLLMAMLLFHFVERKFAHGLVTDKYFWPWQVRRMKDDHKL